MGVYSDVTGFLFISATPNEIGLVHECLAFNRQVIEEIDPNAFWSQREFRLLDECDEVRPLQTISIYKFHNNRVERDAFEHQMCDTFKRLMWDHGFIVDRSIDRAIVGEPLAYEYELKNTSYHLRDVKPVGEDLKLEVTLRA